MKKIFWLIIPIVLSLVFTSCFNKGEIFVDSEKIADETFNEIIAAIKSKDDSSIMELFSDSVKNEGKLSQEVLNFLNFIRGDIVSFSSAIESGVGTFSDVDNGKTKTEIQPSFRITTTENTYYVAIKECIRDDGNDSNIGITSIYIIDSNTWSSDYVYRGDGKWTPGIIIDSENASVDE
jgi:hypothetical protein